MASRVLNRMALALPVFRMDRLARVRSTFSESSLRLILRRAIITSRFTIMAISDREVGFLFEFVSFFENLGQDKNQGRHKEVFFHRQSWEIIVSNCFFEPF